MAGNKQEATLLLKIKETGAEAFNTIKDGLNWIKDNALKAGLAITAFVGAAVNEYMEAEQASNKLNQSLIQQGIYTKALADNYKKMASELQATTTFGDDAIVSAQATMQAYLGQIPITKQLMQATLDLAQAQGMDLDSAAQMVGKSIGTNTNALGRQGIELDANATKSEKLAAVTEALNSKFGGQAAAATNGLGAIIQLKNAFGEIMEAVGQRFAPLLSEVASRMSAFALGVAEGNNNFSWMSSVIDGLASAFSMLKFYFVEVVQVWTAGIATMYEGAKAVLSGNFAQAYEIAKGGLEGIKQLTIENKQTLDAELKMIDQKTSEENVARVVTEEEMKQQAREQAKLRAQEAAILAASEKSAADLEAFNADMAFLNMTEVEKLTLKQQFLEKELQNKKLNAAQKLALEKEYANNQKKLDFETNKAREQGQKETLANIAGLQSSSNKTLAMAGKAAAITQIAIDTPKAVSSALANVPYPFNFAAAAMVGVAMASQAAKIAGVQLASGGIVPATPGGIQATIGEGGRAEAVIPLPDNFDPEKGLGGGMTVNFNGPVLGNETQARELAIALDKEFLKLRRRNESVAFDRDIV